MISIYGQVAAAVADAPDPIVISGDCTTSLGTVAGLQRRGEAPSIVWLDAHGDFNTEETTESGYLGGMPLAKICGLGNLDVLDGLGLATVEPDRVRLVGARDLDAGEKALLVSVGVQRATVAELRPELLPPGPLYLHLDVDVADPEEMSGLLFPVPGGASKAELEATVATVAGSGRLAAVGLALTWDPDAPDPGRAGFLRDVLRPLRN